LNWKLCLTFTLLILLAGALASPGDAFAEEQTMRIVPPPKEIELYESSPIPLDQKSSCIMLPKDADDVVMYAAERLKTQLQSLHGIDLPILLTGDSPASYKTLLVLGVRGPGTFVDALCDESGLDLNDELIGPDGYFIEMSEREGRRIILVVGSNSRGVLYGQDTLLQLMRSDKGSVKFVSGECPMYTDSSSSYIQFKNQAKFRVGVGEGLHPAANFREKIPSFEFEIAIVNSRHFLSSGLFWF